MDVEGCEMFYEPKAKGQCLEPPPCFFLDDAELGRIMLRRLTAGVNRPSWLLGQRFEVGDSPVGIEGGWNARNSKVKDYGRSGCWY